MASVPSTVNYRRPGADFTEFGDAKGSNFAAFPRLVVDARPRRASLSLFHDGFRLVDHGVSEIVNDWYDEEHVRRVYYPSVKQLVRRILPEALRVEVAGHIARDEGDATRLGPHHLAHNDYTEDFLDKICSWMPHLKERLRSSRVVMLNLWRPTASRPLRRNPLALCHRASISKADLVPTLLQHYGTAERPIKDIGLNVYTSKYNAEHRWFYFSDLRRDEVMVFLTYDSHPEGGEFIPTLHTAVPLPGQEREPPRESCEIRVMCLLPLPGVKQQAAGQPPALAGLSKL